jgi:hypothetical protein
MIPVVAVRLQSAIVFVSVSLMSTTLDLRKGSCVVYLLPDLIGGMAERFKAPVLKTGDPRGSVGSNPTPSANFDFQGLQNLIAAETTKANRLSGPLAKF